MATSGPTKAELSRSLDQIADLAEGALDPENSREDLVRSIKEIADLAQGENAEEEEDEEE